MKKRESFDGEGSQQNTPGGKEPQVALLLVCHSAKLAEGLVEFIGHTASRVEVLSAGGVDNSKLGVSAAKISAALAGAELPVLVLSDTASAQAVAERAARSVKSGQNVQLSDAPLVEGALAAAAQAEAGGSLAEVRHAAETAMTPQAWVNAGAEAMSLGPALTTGRYSGSRKVCADMTVRNPLGLHARPAAILAATLSEMDVQIEVNGVDGQSVMLLMTLGAAQGDELHVEAAGPDAQRAVKFVRDQVEAGFGEI